jgi:hypothetical protein
VAYRGLLIPVGRFLLIPNSLESSNSCFSLSLVYACSRDWLEGSLIHSAGLGHAGGHRSGCFQQNSYPFPNAFDRIRFLRSLLRRRFQHSILAVSFLSPGVRACPMFNRTAVRPGESRPAFPALAKPEEAFVLVFIRILFKCLLLLVEASTTL